MVETTETTDTPETIETTDAAESFELTEPTETTVPTVTTATPEINEIALAPEQAPVSAAAPVRTVPAETDEHRQKRLTRDAYNKSGLSVLVLYFAMSVIGSVAMTLIIVPAVIMFFARHSDVVMTLDAGSIGEAISGVMNVMTQTSLGFWIMFGVVVGTGIGLGIGILLQKAVAKSVLSQPIEKRKLTGREYCIYLFAALGLWAVGVYVGNLQSFFGLPSAFDSFYALFEGNSMIPYLVYGVIGAPILEELALRKVLLDKLHGYGQVTAALTSALLFGLIHGNSAQFFLAFNVGLLFAVVYMKTGHVGYTMLLHATINFIGTLPDALSLFGLYGIGTLDFNTLLMLLLVVFAVVGFIVIIVNRKTDLFVLTRSDCPDFRRNALANPGMIVYPIIAVLSVIGTDFVSVISNLLVGYGALALLSLAPTTLFVAAVIVFYVGFGRSPKTAEPAEIDTTIE